MVSKYFTIFLQIISFGIDKISYILAVRKELKLVRDRKPRMKSLWHPGYVVTPLPWGKYSPLCSAHFRIHLINPGFLPLG